MIISLEEQKRNKNRFNLFVDGEFFSGISIDYIVKYQLKDGIELDEEKIRDIVVESETNFAFNNSLKYLSKAMKSEKEIVDHLKSKNLNDEIITNCISKLKEYNYINDELYAKNYVSFYKSKYGKNKLKFNLKQKNIDEKIIVEVLNFDDDENLEGIRNYINKSIKNKELDFNLKQKIIRNLINKGYNFDEIKKAFNKEDIEYEDGD